MADHATPRIEKRVKDYLKDGKVSDAVRFADKAASMVKSDRVKRVATSRMKRLANRICFESYPDPVISPLAMGCDGGFGRSTFQRLLDARGRDYCARNRHHTFGVGLELGHYGRRLHIIAQKTAS